MGILRGVVILCGYYFGSLFIWMRAQLAFYVDMSSSSFLCEYELQLAFLLHEHPYFQSNTTFVELPNLDLVGFAY